MKLAIHKRNGSYSDNWIIYCEENGIDYEVVSCFENNIIEKLKDFDGLLWHWNQDEHNSKLVAIKIIYTLNKMGIPTYPDYNTAFMFDDKIGQKFLFDSLNVPFVRTNIFYNYNDSLNWIKKEKLPKVLKLRGGAAAENVKLIKSFGQAKREISRAFSSGIQQINRKAVFKDKLNKYKSKKTKKELIALIKSFFRFIFPSERESLFPKEIGYVYFQDFLEGNEFDIRLVVIGDRCFGLRRFNRKNDFRASGSGKWSFDPEKINTSDIKMVFEISKKCNFQTMAYDLLSDGEKTNFIEMSCFFGDRVVDKLYLGYWDRELNWHPGSINPQYMIIEDFINSLEIKSSKS